LKGTLKEISLLATTGVMLGGLGYAGLRLTENLVKPATEYTHQLNIMNMAGLTQVEIAKAVGAAWKNTSTVITTTATSNLSMLMDMRQVLQGGLPEAIQMLPIVSKIAAVMAASSEHSISANSKTIAFDITKAMDIMGLNTPEAMEHGASMMAKVVTAFQNRINPAAMASTAFYMRQSRYGLDDAFLWGVLPSMMLERAGGGGGSGGSKGIGPSLAAINRVTSMGIMNKKTAHWFADLGLLGGPILPTTTVGTVTAGLRHQKDWTSNPFFATWSQLVPAMQRRYGAGIVNNPAEMRAILTTSHMTQMALAQFMEWVTKPGNVLRDMANVGVLPALDKLPPLLRNIAEKMDLHPGGGAMDFNDAYRQAMQRDPNTAYAALAAQWDNLKTAFGVGVVPLIVPAIIKLTTALNEFSLWAQTHPNLAQGLTTSFIALSGALAFSGVVLTLTAGFRALGLVLTLGGFAPAALTALSANLGVAAIGFAKIAGPLAVVAGALALLGPSKSFTESQQDWLHSHGLGGESGTGSRLGGWVDSVAEAIKRALHGTSVQMDGKEVGKIVSDHQADEMSKPPADTARIDNKLAPIWPNYSFQQP
jgi:hypothetical protein